MPCWVRASEYTVPRPWPVKYAFVKLTKTDRNNMPENPGPESGLQLLKVDCLSTRKIHLTEVSTCSPIPHQGVFPCPVGPPTPKVYSNRGVGSSGGIFRSQTNRFLPCASDLQPSWWGGEEGGGQRSRKDDAKSIPTIFPLARPLKGGWRRLPPTPLCL